MFGDGNVKAPIFFHAQHGKQQYESVVNWHMIYKKIDFTSLMSEWMKCEVI